MVDVPFSPNGGSKPEPHTGQAEVLPLVYPHPGLVLLNTEPFFKTQVLALP